MTNNIENLFNQVDTLIDQGQLLNAKSKLDDIILQDPKNHEAYMVLGSVFGELGQTKDAIKFLEKSIELNENYAEPYFILGHIYKSLNRFADADTCFNTAMELAPDEIDYLQTLADFYIDTNQHRQSIPILNNILDKIPGDPGILLKLASVSHMANDFESASVYYKILLDTDDCNLSILKPLISIFIESDNLEEASKYLEIGLGKCAHQDEDLYYYQSTILLKQGRSQNALEAIEKALSLGTGKNEFLVHKALVLEVLGEFDTALDTLTPILESGDISFQAAMVFTKLSVVFDMKHEANLILHNLLKKQSLSDDNIMHVQGMIGWLEKQ